MMRAGGTRHVRRSARLQPARPPQDGAVRVVVCVDDTDDLTKCTSTGAIAESIARSVDEEFGGTVELGVTRHQLLLHKDVPYTSHNSAMCFSAWVDPGTVDALSAKAVEILLGQRAATSDPGLCICRVPGMDDACYGDWREDRARLAAFGQRAKRDVIAKQQAYALTERLASVTLSEHGGTGCGVIGALAGVGLRLSGADGRFRGTWDLSGVGDTDAGATAADMRTYLERFVWGSVRIVDTADVPLPDDARVGLEEAAKPILSRGALTLVVEPDGAGGFRMCEKDDLGGIGNDAGMRALRCPHFEIDNDNEELHAGAARSCFNCLYRRWDAAGFTCVHTA